MTNQATADLIEGRGREGRDAAAVIATMIDTHRTLVQALGAARAQPLEITRR
jgi:hypothetical protein